jgi:hypothetical protein
MRKRTYTVRDWVYIGLFGALWGAIELSLGTILHVLFPPVANTFFTGPIAAILMESVLMEGAVFLSSKNRASVFMAAGVLALVWNFLHRFVMLRLLYGKHFTEVALTMAKGASGVFGFAEEKIAAILLTLLLIQIACGAAAGYLAFRLGCRIIRRRESRHEG